MGDEKKRTDGERPPEQAPDADADAGGLWAVLMEKLDWFERRLAEKRRGTALEDVTPAERKLFEALEGGAASVADLARRLGVTRQAAHKTVKSLIARGLVALRPAPESRRDKQVEVTEKGRRARATLVRILREVEAELKVDLGAERVEAIKRLFRGGGK